MSTIESILKIDELAFFWLRFGMLGGGSDGSGGGLLSGAAEEKL